MTHTIGQATRLNGTPRGPQWATAYEMYELVPDIKFVIKGHHTASNFLSHEARAERVKRRDRKATKEFIGRGRPPQFEYNVASVRKRVKDLLSANMR
jgi:hypothetical protein